MPGQASPLQARAANKRCAVAICEGAVKGEGLCGKHLLRLKKYGSPTHQHIDMRGRRSAEPADAVWRLFTRAESGCWEWTGSTDKNGYGRISRNRRTHWAHRFVYELIVEPVPDGLHLDHLCRNRRCVNPTHLEPVTCKENVRRGAGNGSETHCPQGHPYDEQNTYVWRGHRSCRACHRARQAARAA